jgi:hypothetical protein
MKFSYDLNSKYVHLLDKLLRADKRLELDEYKTGTGIGDLNSQIQKIKEKNGSLKFPFLYFYLDKTNYPDISLKSTIVVNKESDLKLSERRLYIKMYGLLGYLKRLIKIKIIKFFPFGRSINNKILSKKFNSDKA